MIDGIVDHLLMKKEVLLLIVIIKICKIMNQNAKEIRSKVFLTQITKKNKIKRSKEIGIVIKIEIDVNRTKIGID